MSRLAALVVILCAAIVLAVVLVPATLPGGPRVLSDQADQADQAAFDRKVRAYLMTHPEVIMESVQALQRRSSDARAAAQRDAIRAAAGALNDSGILPVAGNPDGDVTVVEFFDYRCPYCKRALEQLHAVMKADGNLRVVFKEFPVLGPESVVAAQAAVAASFQGRYLAFHDALMGHEGQLDRAAVMAVAEEAGLDVARLGADMERPEVEATIEKAHLLARRLGINATPTFVVGDRLVAGYMDAAALGEIIAAVRRGR